MNYTSGTQGLSAKHGDAVAALGGQVHATPATEGQSPLQDHPDQQIFKWIKVS